MHCFVRLFWGIFFEASLTLSKLLSSWLVSQPRLTYPPEILVSFRGGYVSGGWLISHNFSCLQISLQKSRDLKFVHLVNLKLLICISFYVPLSRAVSSYRHTCWWLSALLWKDVSKTPLKKRKTPGRNDPYRERFSYPAKKNGETCKIIDLKGAKNGKESKQSTIDFHEAKCVPFNDLLVKPNEGIWTQWRYINPSLTSNANTYIYM